MDWQERWILGAFGRVLVARWTRRITTAGFIAMLMFALAAVIEQMGYVQDRIASPVALCRAAFGCFGLAVAVGLAGAYMTRRRVSR